MQDAFPAKMFTTLFRTVYQLTSVRLLATRHHWLVTRASGDQISLDPKGCTLVRCKNLKYIFPNEIQ